MNTTAAKQLYVGIGTTEAFNRMVEAGFSVTRADSMMNMAQESKDGKAEEEAPNGTWAEIFADDVEQNWTVNIFPEGTDCPAHASGWVSNICGTCGMPAPRISGGLLNPKPKKAPRTIGPGGLTLLSR